MVDWSFKKLKFLISRIYKGFNSYMSRIRFEHKCSNDYLLKFFFSLCLTIVPILSHLYGLTDIYCSYHHRNRSRQSFSAIWCFQSMAYFLFTPNFIHTQYYYYYLQYYCANDVWKVLTLAATYYLFPIISSFEIYYTFKCA